MLLQARALLAELLRPYSYDTFFEEVVGRRPLALLGGERLDRAILLGDDPKKVILDAYDKHAPELTCHALAAKVEPPSPQRVADADAFHSLIRSYHSSGFTVRVPEVTNLSPELRQLTRALELIVESPVGAVIFWSAAGAEAPVHHDDIDAIAIQLAGRKRWFVSNDPPTLPNQWKGVGEAPPKLERYKTIDVGPGDLLYLPRGTAHTVQSTTESIHVSIGFVPVTLRDALIAAIDHLSDLDMPLRAGVTPRADDLANDRGSDFVAQKVRAALQKLHSNALADSFVADAMERRRSRMIADLPKMPPPTESDGVTNLQTRLRHNPLAIAHAIKAGDVIDFSQPGEQIYIHAGAEQGLQFIVETPEFLVADIPGDIGDEVRIALVDRLLTSGFLCRAENEQFDLPQPASANFYA